MKISIITVTFNSAATIKDCIASVNSQTYSDIEHIIIDGNSSDDTLKIINAVPNRITKIISEPDTGIYAAMNKGIKISTGEIVGILNSDDFLFNDKIVKSIANEFNSSQIDALYGDVQFVRPGNLARVVRYYSSKRFIPWKFKFGFMPAHPSFYVKREFFEKYGYYKEDYKIGADFELLIRFLYKHKIRSKYIPLPFVTMRTGGISNRSILSNINLNKDIIRACNENGIKTNFMNIYSKYFIKVFELISQK
jgi:glycosyltransferase involved in cell wall biosynthesis